MLFGLTSRLEKAITEEISSGFTSSCLDLQVSNKAWNRKTGVLPRSSHLKSLPNTFCVGLDIRDILLSQSSLILLNK